MSGPLRIERLSYSSRPWRIVDANGTQLVEWQPYPGNDELPPIRGFMCYDTKTEAVVALGELAGRLLDARQASDG